MFPSSLKVNNVINSYGKSLDSVTEVRDYYQAMMCRHNSHYCRSILPNIYPLCYRYEQSVIKPVPQGYLSYTNLFTVM